MKVERIHLDGQEHYCQFCPVDYVKGENEEETRRRPSNGQEGYRFDYYIICPSCMKGITEGIKILETNEIVRAVEI